MPSRKYMQKLGQIKSSNQCLQAHGNKASRSMSLVQGFQLTKRQRLEHG